MGAENAPVIVIDHFLRDADLLVTQATSQSFTPVTHRAYPGVRAPMPAIYEGALRTLLTDLVATTFGFVNHTVTASESSYSIVTMRPEELHPRQRMPHFDSPDPRLIALLHYLCTPDQGGTSFYRHRSTSYESISSERLPYFDRAVDRELAEPQPPGYINGDTAHFARIAAYGAEFNRMIIYRSCTLHSGDIPAKFFAAEPPRGTRLTANTFFHFSPAEAHPRGNSAR